MIVASCCKKNRHEKRTSLIFFPSLFGGPSLYMITVSFFILSKFKLMDQVISDLGSGDPFLSGLWYLPPGCSAAKNRQSCDLVFG